MSFADVVNVADFGAVGNGTTDNTVAFQAAIDYAYNQAKSQVYVPDGNYLIGATLHLRRGIVLQGSGSFDSIHGSRLKRANGVNGPIIATTAYFDSTTFTHFFGIQNFFIDGNEAGQTAESPTIAFYGVFVGSFINNVALSNNYGPGIRLEYAFDVYINRVWISQTVTSTAAFVINTLNISGGPIGLVDIGNLYVENTSNKRFGDPRNVQADRGVAMDIRTFHSISINELHLESCQSGVSLGGTAAGLLRVGKTTLSYGGDGTASSAVYKFNTIPAAVDIGPVRVLNAAANFNHYYNSTTNQVIPTVSVSGGDSGGLNRAAVPVSLVSPDIVNDITQRLYGGAAATYGKMFCVASAPSNYHYSKGSGAFYSFGSKVNQISEIDFIRMESYGNTGDCITFLQPITIASKASAGNKAVGAIYKLSDASLGVGPVYQRASNAAGADCIATVMRGTAAPTVIPNYIGQMYVDTTNRKLYVATGKASSGDWTILN